MKTRVTRMTQKIKSDECLFCGTKLDWQNEGILDDGFIEDNFHLRTWMHDVPCPQCGATHTATFVVDKEDFVGSNTDEWWVRVGGGWMEFYGYYEDEEGEKKEFSFDMECTKIEASLDEDEDDNDDFEDDNDEESYDSL